jgi:paraquat-inducible protein B
MLMTETPRDTELPPVPAALAVAKSRRPMQVVWLVPLAAVLIGGWLAVKAVRERGPVITISFKTAEGIEAGKTRIKYKSVDIGLVKSVTLSEDRTRVIATAELTKQSEGLLVSDTTFWVARARITGGSVSGLGTLLAGSYIGVDVGKAEDEQREFVGLEVPPLFTTDSPGRQFVLHAANLGSLDIGAPVYFRRIQAGQVVSYKLDADGGGVAIRVFINAPYDKFVNPHTRFWQASGFDVTLDSAGVRLQTESVVSMLLGGLAFETRSDAPVADPSPENMQFELYAERAAALRHPDTIVETYVLAFRESVRGLVRGSPVDFSGVVIGEVSSINIDFSSPAREYAMLVEINLYPERLQRRYRSDSAAAGKKLDSHQLLDRLVARGLRAQVRSGNLLTGQLYVALDFFPDAPRAKIDWRRKPVELPSMRGSLQELQQNAADVAKRLSKVPFEQLGADLRQTLQSAATLMQRLDSEVTPEAHNALVDARKALSAAERTLSSAERALSADAPLQQDAREAMREIARAAQAFRVLADYLERHPEALIGGKKEDEK